MKSWYYYLILLLTVHLLLSADHPYIPKYVWNLGFSIAADVSPFSQGLPQNYVSYPPISCVHPVNYIKNVQENDIIWLQSSMVGEFCDQVLPTIECPFNLIINDGDEAFPSSQDNKHIFKLLKDKRVLHIFAQNVDYPYVHRKVSQLPIGIDFHSMTRSWGFFWEPCTSVKDQEKQLDNILSTLLPTSERKLGAFCDFHFTNNTVYGGETRLQILQTIIPSGVIEFPAQPLPRHLLWQKKGQYAFSVSPHGLGLDCHRTWEDLILGCIVIVKSSPLDPIYEGLPVVIVKQWSEITKDNCIKWLIKYGDAFTNPSYRKKLTHSYWMEMIRSYKKDQS